MNARLKKRREQIAFAKLGEAQFEYMEMLERNSKIATPADRTNMLNALQHITELYVGLKRLKQAEDEPPPQLAS